MEIKISKGFIMKCNHLHYLTVQQFIYFSFICACASVGTTDLSVTMVLTFADWAWLIMRILQSLDLCIQKDNFWACFKSSWQFLSWVPSWVGSPSFLSPFKRKTLTSEMNIPTTKLVFLGVSEWVNFMGWLGFSQWRMITVRN